MEALLCHRDASSAVIFSALLVSVQEFHGPREEGKDK